jgi:hypothetical protein
MHGEHFNFCCHEKATVTGKSETGRESVCGQMTLLENYLRCTLYELSYHLHLIYDPG